MNDSISIGQRAAKAIRQRAKETGNTLEVEFLKVGVSRQVVNRWENTNLNPSAYYLQQMALAGYDINWILTGGSNETK